MVILGASGGITLSSVMMEDVGELVGVSNRLPKKVSNLPLLFLTQTLMHSKTKQVKATK